MTEVHLWRIDTRPSGLARPDLLGCLDAVERQRAERCRKIADRERFVLQRSGLRRILASYLAVAPGEIAFELGPNGKPALAVPGSSHRLRFNMSHAGDLAVIAVGQDVELGVDIEPLGAGNYSGRLARRLFSPAEWPRYAQLPPEARDLAFLRAWTRKEAYLKGTGEGLALPLRDVVVSFLEGEAPALIEVVGRPREPARWTMMELAPAAGYLGALAVAAPAIDVRWVDLHDGEAAAPLFGKACPRHG